ncbi:MAG: class I SAM-dependent DNA methyltransferase, partial [Microthrixaceae bacterium]
MDWDDYAGGWDEDPSVRAYAQAALDSLEREVRSRGLVVGGDRALDFGCGTGLLAEHLREKYSLLDALDTSSGMRAVVEQKAALAGWTDVRVLESLPTAGERYDLIVCSSVCAFLDDYPETVADLSARLVPGGMFVQWDWELDPNEAEPFGLARSEVENTLASAGLLDVDVALGFTVGEEPEVMRPIMG